MKTGCIYRITNTINGKVYVGQTFNLQARIERHFCANGGCPLLSNAIKKYGETAFEYKIVEANISASDLNRREIYWIDYFDCIAPRGYNLSRGGRGGIPSEETRQKMSEGQKRRNHSGENHPLYGKSPSAETRLKISRALKGRKHTAEAKANMSRAVRGKNHPHYGKSPSAKTRQRLSKSKRGKNHPQHGKPLSAEHKRKISEGNKRAHARRRAKA